MRLTLVFPASVPAGLEYIGAARQRGEPVIAASSQPRDPAADLCPWFQLPSIYDPEFDDVFQELLRSHKVTHLYAPVTLVYCYLQDLLDRTGLTVSFVSPAPFYEAIDAVGSLLDRSRALRPFVQSCAEPASAPTTIEIAAVLRATFAPFGESYETKTAAMIGILSTLPEGDVVEIGALFGRSATTLVSALAISGATNPILAVDPWRPAPSVQESLPAALKHATLETNWDAIADGFDINLLPLARRGRFNRLRTTSLEAFARYQRDRLIETDVFGCTTYHGRIACLHIDGNHDYDCVQADQDSWGSMVTSGGWVIHDDYGWVHGDGPRRVGDSLLRHLGDGARRSFVAGGALFVQYD